MAGRDRSRRLMGEALAKARKAAGITQETLAFEAELERTYISHLENGHKSPTVDTLFRLCPVLGIAPSQLMSQVERALETRRK